MPSPAVPVWAAEPAGQRAADGGGAHQAVQQHPGARGSAHRPVELRHAARSAESPAEPRAAGPLRPAPGLPDGQYTPHCDTILILSVMWDCTIRNAWNFAVLCEVTIKGIVIFI